MSGISFFWELCKLASVSSIVAAGTTFLGVCGTLAYPIADLVRELWKNGLSGAGQHWRERLKFSFIIGVVWWLLLFSYQLFYAVPQRIRTQAGRIAPAHATHPPIPPTILLMKYTALSPSLPIIVRLQFKASTLFTQSRQATILRDVNSFCTYLIFLGFKLPQDFPPIGVRDVSGYAYVQPAPVMYAQINIQDRRIDERNAIIGPFAGWLFHALLPGLVTDPKAWFDSDRAYLYAAHYTDSFEKRYTKLAQTAHLADWQNALWELRTKYGPGFVDHLLLYSYQSWAPPEPNDNFDRFFWARFQAGLFVIDNNAEHYDGVISVMKAYGLTRPSQEQK